MGLAGTPEFVAPRGQAGWRSPAMVLASLSALALGAWLITDHRMAGMDAGPGSDLGSLGYYTTAWVVMMTAMMFPSISPMLLVAQSIAG
jgi:hypothetical protein